jgi:hypothetical protein
MRRVYTRSNRRSELNTVRKSAERNPEDRRENGQSNDSPLGADFLIGTHNWSRTNIIECEIDGSVKNERRVKIKRIAIEIEIIRMKSDDSGTKARKSCKGTGSGRGNFDRQLGQNKQ